MSGDVIETKTLIVDVQANGIIRRHDTGYLIARLTDTAKYEDLPATTPPEYGHGPAADAIQDIARGNEVLHQKQADPR